MAPAPQFLGPDGLPITRQALTQPITEPQIGGVRNIFSELVAPGLTPERLTSVLRESAEGYGRDYLTMGEEMEEREHHYGGVLTTRKLAVGSIAPAVDANTCEDRIAQAVQQLVGAPDFYDLVLACSTASPRATASPRSCGAPARGCGGRWSTSGAIRACSSTTSAPRARSGSPRTG